MWEQLTGSPWLAAAGVALAALLVFALVKRLLKLALLLLLALAALLAWSRLTGRELPEGLRGVARQAGAAAEGAVEKTGDLLRRGREELEEESPSQR